MARKRTIDKDLKELQKESKTTPEERLQKKKELKKKAKEITETSPNKSVLDVKKEIKIAEQLDPTISLNQIIMFSEAYLSNGMVASDAYRTAFPNEPETSPRLFTEKGNRILKKPETQAYIQAKMDELQEASKITKASLLLELNEIKERCRLSRSPIETANWIKAIELQTKMLGFNEPDKMEVKLVEAAKIDWGLDLDITDVEEVDDEE